MSPSLKKILYLLTIIIVVLGVWTGYTYLQIRTKPLITNPSEFTKSFDPTGYEASDLHVGGIEGRTIKSPYFPYRKLATTAVIPELCQTSYEGGKKIDKSTEDRYINQDLLWKLFWVEISDCVHPAAFYGPFRY